MCCRTETARIYSCWWNTSFIELCKIGRRGKNEQITLNWHILKQTVEKKRRRNFHIFCLVLQNDFVCLVCCVRLWHSIQELALLLGLLISVCRPKHMLMMYKKESDPKVCRHRKRQATKQHTAILLIPFISTINFNLFAPAEKFNRTQCDWLSVDLSIDRGCANRMRICMLHCSARFQNGKPSFLNFQKFTVASGRSNSVLKPFWPFWPW